MAKKLKKLMAVFLALVMCVTLISTTAFAAQTIDGNTWYGDELAVDVTAGTEGYTFMSLFRKPAHGYEFSGHFLGDGEGPQTFVVIDTVAHDGTTWTPSGIYAPNESNYEVTYCCDVETMIVDGTYYKRLNLEDSEYYNDAQAAKIRAIVTNSYPYVALEDMKADLAKNGYAYANELTRNEIIAAVQAAIWASANDMTAEDLRYQKSYKVSDNLQWGYPLHDTSAESGPDVAGKRVFKTYEEVGTRINSLVDYLLAQNATYADKAQILITDMKMIGAPVARSTGEQTFSLEIALNNSGSGYEDNINITVTAGDREVVVPVELGKEVYSVQIDAKSGDEIKAVVSGTQVLPAGVYFYAPKAADVNGDGVATGREVSQNLVGVAMGATPVYAEATLRFEEVTFNSGEVSNISYMFINKETGEVEFIKKIDVNEGATSAPVIVADGYVSVMFMKQSTSGMFWFSEEVDEATQQAAIDCLIDNNPSYKGYNAIAFGAGDHELEFKPGKFVTYTFNAGEVVIGDEDVKDDASEEEDPVVPETPTVPETPSVSEPVLNVDVKGAEIASWTVADGVTAVYIAANGKVPAVIWTSEEVDAAALSEITEELGAEDAKYVFGFGDQKIEYKQNKNKTKTVTYTFEEIEVIVENPTTEAEVEETEVETKETATEAPAEETAPAKPFHKDNETYKTHLLGDAEGTPELFNFKVVEEYIPAQGEERYASVGGGEQTEFWSSFLYTTPSEDLAAKNLEEGKVILTYKNGENIETRTFYTGAEVNKGRPINGIYLDGEFYPGGTYTNGKFTSAQTENISYTDSKLQASYNGLQQGMLMNGNGKKVAVYCADQVTGTTSKALYNVVNLEDAVHYDEATAGMIRAVAVNGYWGGIEEVNQYGTLEKVKAMMAASGEFTQEEINHLSPGVALAATQFAIWELANEDDNRQIVNVQYIVKNRVAGYNGQSWNTLKNVVPESEVPCVDLIFKLSNYLVNLDPIPASEMSTANTVLNYKNILKDVNIDVVKKDDGHANNMDANKDNDAFVTNVTFDMLQVSEKDSLAAKIVDADGNVYATGRIVGEPQDGEIQLTNNGNGTYTFPGVTLIENAETTYTVVVEGVQYLERNVYLYFAGERETSQTMIGYDEGEFSVNVESSVKKTFNVDDPTVSFEKGKASNISFMLIDKATGEVEFLYKKDIGGETSFEIPYEAGKVSAVFIKQSTSGMFWFSEKVDEATQQAVIDCLKDNNPSYKGHNAIAFGEGEHKLEFKKNKFATYTFG